MAVFHYAVADNDVFRWTIDAPAVRVPAGLDGYAVISGIKFTALNQHVFAGIRITAVAVGAVIADGQVSYSYILAIHRMDIPEGSVNQSESFD